jgi:EAL domain-containing protein (putative c-di-GMP-specific phosphodiesterase class I)/GGDEF domain-containing protein
MQEIVLKRNEGERVAVLEELGILNANTSEYFDSVTRLAADMFGVSGSYLSLIDGDRQWLKSTVGFCAPSATSASRPSANYTIEQARVMVIEDTRLDQRFADNPMVTGPSGIRFYAGAPLVTPEGYAIGALCLVDTSPRTLSADDQDKLASLAALVMAHIMLGRAVGHVDAVSGMPNKYQMIEDLTAAAARNPGQNRVLADIDMPDAAKAFEIIRVLGVSVYDQLVRETGRLKRLFEGRAQVYHLTDARFAVLSNDDDTESFITFLYSLEAELQAPLHNLNVPLVLPSFGGIVVFDLCSNSAKDAPRKAAAAVNQALISQQRWSIYNNVEDERQKRAFRLLNDVSDGIAAGDFQLLYQPKHDLVNGACLSAEALLRWHHAELGPISPAEFIPLVEKTALIGPLSHWVMRTAIRQIGEWHADGHAIKVAINLSAYNFEEPDLLTRLAALCSEFGIDPRYVEIECTEGIWMEGAGILQTLHDIRALGMSLALDDFGTGYSNFAYLQKVPASVVKVDQSLIRNVHENPRDQRIVRSLIGLAKELDYQVVAEGVETEQSLHLIREWGCHIAQGYHFARPLTAPDFIDHAIRYRDAHMAAAA